MSLLVIIALCAAGYWYVKKKRANGDGGDPKSFRRAKLGSNPAISDEKLMQINNSNGDHAIPFEEFKRIEQTYGPSLRQALEMLFGTLIVDKQHKLRNGNDDLTVKEISRAVATIDQDHVIPAFKGNQEDYNLWWQIVLDFLFAAIKIGEGTKKQAQAIMAILVDYETTNHMLGSLKFSDDDQPLSEILKEMQDEDGEFFSSGGDKDYDVKFKLRTARNGQNYYELSGAYEFFATDISQDEITSRVELLIASVHNTWNDSKMWRNSIEQFPMPSTTRLQDK